MTRAKTARPQAGTPAAAPSLPRRSAANAPDLAEAELAEKVSSSDQIVAEILRGLYDGRYVAGQKLPEADLTRKFGVGRGSVREALRRLAAEGVVTVSMHRGASIRCLSRDDVRDIIEVVEYIAGLAARLAAERISRPEDAQALRAIVAAMKLLAPYPGSFEFVRVRNQFYDKMTVLSGNRELVRLLSTVQVHLVRIQFRAAYWDDFKDRGLANYERTAEAIVAGDGASAEKVFRQHVRAYGRAIEKLPDSHFG